VVERLLAGRRFAHVGVWTTRPLQPALRGMEPVPDEALEAFGADTAVVVFDRQRHANGRELAFARPDPADLIALATRLRAAGVQVLLVVVPHAAGSLPQALTAGLASLDEGAVAALGFSHLVFMRSAQDGRGAATDEKRSPPERLVHWMLGQLQWMVPQRDQPVRALTVARAAARLATELPRTPPGTRVLPPEWLWAAAQSPRTDRAIDGWLAGEPLSLSPGQVPSRQRW
jgi:hypothetical protein